MASAAEIAYTKEFLGIIGSAQDAKIAFVFDASAQEAANFMNRDDIYDFAASELTSEYPEFPAPVYIAVLLLCQASYCAQPDEATVLRNAAEIKLMPYRLEIGV